MKIWKPLSLEELEEKPARKRRKPKPHFLEHLLTAWAGVAEILEQNLEAEPIPDSHPAEWRIKIKKIIRSLSRIEARLAKVGVEIVDHNIDDNSVWLKCADCGQVRSAGWARGYWHCENDCSITEI
jgi:hypothetical protein